MPWIASTDPRPALDKVVRRTGAGRVILKLPSAFRHARFGYKRFQVLFEPKSDKAPNLYVGQSVAHESLKASLTHAQISRGLPFIPQVFNGSVNFLRFGGPSSLRRPVRRSAALTTARRRPRGNESTFHTSRMADLLA